MTQPLRTAAGELAASGRRPEVIVDFAVEDGDLVVSVDNIGSAPARDVRVRFDRPFNGAGGVRIDALRLFHGIPFLAPGRRITAFVDLAGSYFARREPTALSATATFADAAGERYESVCPHDLAIYADLPARIRRGKGEAEG